MRLVLVLGLCGRLETVLHGVRSLEYGDLRMQRVIPQVNLNMPLTRSSVFSGAKPVTVVCNVIIQRPNAKTCQIVTSSSMYAAYLGNDLPLCFPLGAVGLPMAGGGPLFIKSPKPRSFHAGSLCPCVARWMPNAACWSGTTSSSSSGLTG